MFCKNNRKGSFLERLIFLFSLSLLFFFSFYSFGSNVTDSPERKDDFMTLAQAIDKNTLTLHFSADGRLPYDWYASWIVNDAFLRAVYGTLTSVTPNGLFSTDDDNSILDSIETVNGDPSKLIFTMKQGLFFQHEDEKIEATAEDLKFSYSIPFFLKQEDIFEKSDLLKIKGMEEIKPGKIYNDKDVSGIKVIDKFTIQIDLKYPDPNFITNLSTSKYPIVSKYLYLNKKNEYLTPGLGKYKVIYVNKKSGEAILKRKVTVDGFPDYVKFISTDDSRGDILWKDMWGKLQNPYEQELIQIPYGTLGLFFNYETEIGKNKSFREAINFALDRNKLCHGYPYLIPNSQTLPNDYWGRIDVQDKQNIERSKKLFSHIKNIPNPLIIKVFGQSESELQKPYFQELKNQLINVGLNPKYVLDKGNQKTDSIMFITGIAVPYKDPAAVFQFFSSGSFYENGYEKDDAIIKSLLNELISSYSDKDKLQHAKRLSKYLHDNKIFVPLWDLLSVYNVNQDRVETLGDQAGGMRFDIWNVRLKK